MNTVIQMELLELVKAMQQFQNDNLPKGVELSISLTSNTASVDIHTKQEHSIGLEVKRLIGLEDAEKVNFQTDHIWHILRGPISESVHASIYCNGLPPMCRIETFEEEIPKTQIVDLPETVKVKRTRICCGGEK